MVVTKIKLRVCDVCKVKKKVAEFSTGKICNSCEGSASTLREESTDDEVEIPKDNTDKIPNVDANNLHEKIDLLNQRLDRMETLMLGLMDLMGKINYDMEIKKADF
jgi:hypothetical protein